MTCDASLVVKREGWEGCLIFEVEVMSMLGVPWLGLGLGPPGTGTGSKSHVDHSSPYRLSQFQCPGLIFGPDAWYLELLILVEVIAVDFWRRVLLGGEMILFDNYLLRANDLMLHSLKCFWLKFWFGE